MARGLHRVRVLNYSMIHWMRKLLLLAFPAVASEAMAQDAQCVRERAAMVETIRAYARRYAGALPQGISESVLEAVAQTERHRFHPRPFLFGGI
jgi:hypothetical protein